MQVTVLILAAGASRRMGPGRDKLLEPVGNQPMLTHICQQALATGHPILVTLPSLDHSRADVVPQGVQVIEVPDAASGMAASFRRAGAELQDKPSDVLVVPADMPDLTTEDFQKVIQRHDGTRITRATTATGKPGHPVLFPKNCVDLMGDLTGDTGAQSILRSHPAGVQLIPLPGDRAVTDLDTPEAWDRWRAENSTK